MDNKNNKLRKKIGFDIEKNEKKEKLKDISKEIEDIFNNIKRTMEKKDDEE